MSVREQARAYVEALGLDGESRRRILIALSCPDSETIPKIPQAGEIITDGELRYQLMHNGVRIVENCYYGEWMTELIKLLKGHHEPQEERVFHEVLKYLPTGSTMIELGSFWGYYSLWFRSAVAHATNYLLEPDPSNLAAGKRNFEINSANGQFYQFSIGRKFAGLRPFRCESDGVERLIAETSIDHFLSSAGVNRVDVLLADVQGAELSMLEGAIESISRGKLRFLFLSTHHHSISGDPLTHQRCLRFLTERGAHVIAAHNVTESYSGDGLIVASFEERDRQMPKIEISKNHPSNSLFRELEYDLYEARQLRDIPDGITVIGRIKAALRRLRRVPGAFARLRSSLRAARTLERRTQLIQEALGRIEERQLAQAKKDNLLDNEFRAFSQGGEDGIIQFLLRHVNVERKIFVEFGADNYDLESNTRFLLTNNNWTGLVMDRSPATINRLRKSSSYLLYDLRTVSAFITRDNVNDLLRDNGITGEIGLLSIDIDGNDYWIWRAIDVVDPVIVIVEYNHRFGSDCAVTIPYDEHFDRSRAHHSKLYFGASLKALCLLGDEKGYAFVGCNRNGVNAFFVRGDKKPEFMKALTAEAGFVPGSFGEMIQTNGGVVKLTPAEEENYLKNLGLPLINVGELA